MLLLCAAVACGDDSAAPEQPRFAPTAPTLLSTGSPTKDEDPSVIRARDGSMVVAWFSDRGGNAGDIYITRTADGANWAPAVRVTTSADGDFYPQLYQDGDGTFHLVWFRWYALNRGHIMHNASASALSWNPAAEDTVTTAPDVDDWVPSVTGTADSLLVFFVSEVRDGTNPTSEIYLTSRGPGATAWTPPVPVPGVNSATEHDHLPFAAWTGGGYTLVWVRHDTSQPAPWLNPPPNSQLYIATSATGASWSAPAAVTDDPAPIVNVFPQLYRRQNGAWRILWLSTRTGAAALFELPLANAGIYPTGVVANTALPRLLAPRGGDPDTGRLPRRLGAGPRGRAGDLLPFLQRLDGTRPTPSCVSISRMRVKSGTSLGPYVVEGPLGAGGMGEVYRARDPRLGREVAIKVLNAAPDADSLARFQREARATALLAHSNILTVYDVGVHDGAPFLVCELLDGQTLRERLDAGALDASTAVSLALQLARGVAAAHALRVVHRDLKPDNIFLTRSGAVKILDFGLAKLKSEPTDLDAKTIDVSAPGKLIGTPAYMAPEQVRGALVDERADIFAIGTILYEMLEGKHPFRRGSVAETIAAVLREDPAPPEAGGSGDISRVVMHCLEKKPEERYQSGAELAVALEAAKGEAARSAAAPRDRDVSSIAVLPFLDMSAGHDQDYLCDGLAEELINSFTHVDGLRVSARSSSFQFKGAVVDARAVGARLGVDTVLEGSVRKAGEQLRVTVRLVDVADGYQRWAQRYDRRLDDVFAIQDEIAESVATALRGILSRREVDALHRPGTKAEAYEYFLRGRQMFNANSRSLAGEATAMFERAIEIDSGYAPAYAGLTLVHAWSYEWWGGGDAAYDAADRASRRALELGPQLSESHTARAFVLALRGQYAEASREFDEALRLNPNSFIAYYLYARTCFAGGLIEKSAELFQRGSEVEQDDFQCPILLSQSLRIMGRLEEATAANREGIRRAERRLELNPRDTRALSIGGTALCDDGQNARALEWTARAIEIAPDDSSSLVNGACVRAKLGMKEEALNYLEVAVRRGSIKRDWIEHDPDYNSLRGDPRFQALLAKS